MRSGTPDENMVEVEEPAVMPWKKIGETRPHLLEMGVLAANRFYVSMIRSAEESSAFDIVRGMVSDSDGICRPQLFLGCQKW